MSRRWATRWKGLSPILPRRRWPASRPATSRWRISRWTVFLLNGTASSTSAADEIGSRADENRNGFRACGPAGDARRRRRRGTERARGGGRGHRVTVYTRRDDPDLPERVETPHDYTVVHVPAGPPEHLPTDEVRR